MNKRARVIGTTGGALGFGAFAAATGACCGLPWAVALFGVSGAVTLARLSFLLPYALLGALTLLAIAFWSAYWPVTACADVSCGSKRRQLHWIVWTGAALVLGLAAVALTLG